MPANGRFPEAERSPATVLNKYFDLLYTGLHIALRQHIASRSAGKHPVNIHPGNIRSLQ
jgi:hypothetical protein